MGGLLLALAALLVLPAIVGLVSGEGLPIVAAAFGTPILLSATSGGLLRWRGTAASLDPVRAMLLCGVAWVVLSIFGALPLIIVLGMPAVDALFEIVSGFTTTGITLLTGLDSLPASVLAWRALTQWCGGLGILSLFMLVMGDGTPGLANAEAHKIESGRPHPGLIHSLRTLWGIYTGFTAAVAVGLLAAGLSPFDAFTHALTTLSTGGFSTHDDSIAWFHDTPARARMVDWVIIAGMLAGGTSFLVHARALRGDWRAWWDGVEVRAWLAILGIAWLGLVIEQHLTGRGVFARGPLDAAAIEELIRTNLFQVLAIATTTGFGTEDIGSSWFGPASQLLFLALMFVGGCVGSTGGGFKVLRVVLLGRLFDRTIAREILPRRALHHVVLDGRVVPDDELHRVAGLFFAWTVLILLGGMLTALSSGHDALASVSGLFSALNNIGPCYIPVAELPELPDATKLTWIAAMLLGRLEIVPIALLMSRRAWGV